MQYLVILSHTMDDIPIRLFEDRDEALAFADGLPWEAPSDLMQRLELPDCSTPASVTIVVFNNEGLPISRVIVKEYDDEEF